MIFILLLLITLRVSHSVPVVDVAHTVAASVDAYSLPSYPLPREPPETLKSGSTRTRPDIIQSCLATILACTWVAIHPNLPGPHESGFQRFRRRLFIMICMIMLPEFIVLWAIRQRIAACRIKKEFNDRYFGGVDPELSFLIKVKQWFKPTPVKPKAGWTLTHAFFVQMGGFMLCDRGEPVKVLTFKRLNQSIEKGEVDVSLCVTEQDITDKSKGDLLSKSVAVGQATWFVAQCIARRRAHLPLAELEVLTLAFAALNVVIYGLWWSKPQGVEVPIKFESKGPFRNVGVSPIPTESYSPDLASVESVGENDDGEESDDPEYLFEKGSCHFLLFIWPRWGDSLWRRCMTISPSRLCYYIAFPFLIPIILAQWVGRAGVKAVLNCYYPVKSGTEEIWVAVSGTRVPMFYAEDSDFGVLELYSVAAIAMGFGGIHLIIWSASFPSPLIGLLWRVSAMFVTVQPLVCGVLLGRLAVFITKPFLESLTRPEGTPRPSLAIRIGGYMFGFCGYFYVVARVVLIFLSFFTLFDLSEDVYQTIEWIDSFPHL